MRTEGRFTSSDSPVYAFEYQYDEAGNRTAKILSNPQNQAVTFSSDYSDNNLLSSVSRDGSVVASFEYDLRGNQYTRVADAETWIYSYDRLNRLTQWNRTSPTSYTIGSFTYDPLGRRIEKKTQNDTVIRRYIYDGNSVVAETDGSNNIIAWYTPGICETRYDPALAQWKTLYYHDDGLGSTRQLTDNLQRVVDAYSYNAWGELMGSLRPASDPGKPENPYRFVGKSGYYSDDETGLQLLGARYYDPLLGRFITQDPSRDGLNWYAYGGNNPVNAVDPTGLSMTLSYHIVEPGEGLPSNPAWFKQPAWHSKQADGIDKAFGLLAAGAAALGYFTPYRESARALGNFLTNNGDDIEIDLGKLIRQDAAARGDYYRNRKAALTFASKYLAGQEAPYHIVSNIVQSGAEEGKSNWFLALGGFDVFADAMVWVSGSGKGKRIRMNYTYYMHDPYNQQLFDTWHEEGIGRIFQTTGSYTVNGIKFP